MVEHAQGLPTCVNYAILLLLPYGVIFNFVSWKVTLTKKSIKQLRDLPENVRLKLQALIKEIEVAGPVRGNWPNYSKLGGPRHHCHIKDGRPSYVACWEVIDSEVRFIEVYYVGSREKAPY